MSVEGCLQLGYHSLHVFARTLHLFVVRCGRIRLEIAIRQSQTQMPYSNLTQ